MNSFFSSIWMIVKGRVSAATQRIIAKNLFVLAIPIIMAACTTDATRRDYLRRQAASLPTPTHPVIVIPGFGVTRLIDSSSGRTVWGSARSMVHRSYRDDLDLPPKGADSLVPRGFVGSRGPVNTAWQLTHALRRYGGYSEADVFALEYDWRLSVTEAARRLDNLIEKIRAQRNDPTLKVDLVTHSAGGLVALAYLKLGTASLENPSTWTASAHSAASKVNRLVLIAAPEEGTPEALRLLTRGERIIRRLITPEDAATFASITELLPTGDIFIDEKGQSRSIDLLRLDDWRTGGLGIFRGESPDPTLVRAFGASLERAALVRRALRKPFEGDIDIIRIAGDCVATAKRVLLRDNGTLAYYPDELRTTEKALRAWMFTPGDGGITVESATRGGAEEALLFCDGHQGIATDPNVHRAIVRSLREPAGPRSAPASGTGTPPNRALP